MHKVGTLLKNKQMFLHHIIQTLFVISGIIALLAAILDWEWFFASDNAAPLVRRIGRTKSRWLYGTMGMVLIATAIGFYFQIKNSV